MVCYDEIPVFYQDFTAVGNCHFRSYFRTSVVCRGNGEAGIGHTELLDVISGFHRTCINTNSGNREFYSAGIDKIAIIGDLVISTFCKQFIVYFQMNRWFMFRSVEYKITGRKVPAGCIITDHIYINLGSKYSGWIGLLLDGKGGKSWF